MYTRGRVESTHGVFSVPHHTAHTHTTTTATVKATTTHTPQTTPQTPHALPHTTSHTTPHGDRDRERDRDTDTERQRKKTEKERERRQEKMKEKTKDKTREDQDEGEEKRDEGKDDFVEKCLRTSKCFGKIPVGRFPLIVLRKFRIFPCFPISYSHLLTVPQSWREKVLKSEHPTEFCNMAKKAEKNTAVIFKEKRTIQIFAVEQQD